MHTKRGKTFLFFIAIPLALIGVMLLVQEQPAGMQQFRGIVRYPMMHIGGEGSRVMLVTTTEVYDLFLSPDVSRGWQGQAPDGAAVIVVGIPGKRHGMERHTYNAIDVTSIVPDVLSPNSPKEPIE